MTLSDKVEDRPMTDARAALEQQASGYAEWLTTNLADPQWRPSRVHAESARNYLEQVCAALSSLPAAPASNVREALGSMYRAMDTLDGGEDTAGCRAGALREVERAVAALERVRDAAASAGWREPSSETLEQWAHRLAERRQGQKDPPRCEPPGEYEIRWARDCIREVLSAAPSAPAPSGGMDLLGALGDANLDSLIRDLRKYAHKKVGTLRIDMEDVRSILALHDRAERAGATLATPPAQEAPGEQISKHQDALERIALLDEADGHTLTEKDAFRAVAIATTTLGKHPSEIHSERYSRQIPSSAQEAPGVGTQLLPVNPLATPPASAEKTATGGGE